MSDARAELLESLLPWDRRPAAGERRQPLFRMRRPAGQRPGPRVRRGVRGVCLMSAWAELINADGSDEWLELCSRALKEVQEEALRRAARKIRAEIRSATGNPELRPEWARDIAVDDRMAALIDPKEAR